MGTFRISEFRLVLAFQWQFAKMLGEFVSVRSQRSAVRMNELPPTIAVQ